MASRDALQAASRGWDALTIRRAFCGCQRDGRRLRIIYTFLRIAECRSRGAGQAYCRNGRKYNIAPSANTVRVTTSKIRRFCFGCHAIDASALLGPTFGLRADWTSMVRLTRRPRSDNARWPDFTVSRCWLTIEGTKRSTSPATKLTITRPKTNRSRKHVKATSHLASIATTTMAKRSTTKSGCWGALCNPFQFTKAVMEKQTTRNNALFGFLTGQYSP